MPNWHRFWFLLWWYWWLMNGIVDPVRDHLRTIGDLLRGIR